MPEWNFYENFNPLAPDATSVGRQTAGSYADSGLTILKGTYKATVGKPRGAITTPFVGREDFCQYVDENGILQSKRFSVDSITYLAETDKLEVVFTVIENPIPLFILWGAVAVIVLTVGAMSVNSVLEKIEPVVSGAVVTPIDRLGKEPLAWGILLVFLIPAVAGLITTWKASR